MAHVENNLAKPAGQGRFQRADLVPCQFAKSGTAPAEAGQLGPVAGWRDDQGTTTGDGRDLSPPMRRSCTQGDHLFLRAFALTPWCQHTTGKPGDAANPDLGAGFVHANRRPATGKLQRRGEAGQTAPRDGDHSSTPVTGT